jgi:trk system potassium uptake protein TrkA
MAGQNIVVAGAGRFGSQVATSLFQLGHDVLAIDSDQARIQGLIGRVTYSVAGDVTDEILMRDLGVENFDVAIVAIGRNVESSIMTAVLLRSLEIPTVVARARNQLHAETLQRIGCQRIINAEEEAGMRLAQTLFTPNVTGYLPLGGPQGISRLPVPERFGDKTLREAGFTEFHDQDQLSVLALIRDENARLIPDLDERTQQSDEIVVAGHKDLVDELVE